MTNAQLPEFDDSQYRFAPKEADYRLQWENTYRLLRGAEMAGVLDMPAKPLTPGVQPGEITPAIESIPNLDALNPVRIRVMAEQLWLLGYLPKKPKAKDSGRIQSNPAFKKAVRRFQAEAGLTIDHWIGNQTWRALEAMVGYESESRIERWMRSDGNFKRAFRRAVQLRLWTYGLAQSKPGKEFNGIPRGNLEKLKKVLWSLSLIDDYRVEINRRKLYAILFDSECLVSAAARFRPMASPSTQDNDSFGDKSLDHVTHKGVSELKRRFLVNLAKIELWLIGSDIKIDGRDDYPVAGLKSNRRVRPHNTGPGSQSGATDKIDWKVRKYLREYWRDLSALDKKGAYQRAKFITPSLFKSFRRPEEFNVDRLSPFDEADYSKQIAADFENNHDPQMLIARSYAEGKKLGMNLWDGLKRLWGWVKRGVQKIVSFAKNVFRAFYRFALKGFVIVRTAFSAFTRSLDQYLAGHIALRNGDRLTVQIEKDMDYRIVITAKAQTQEVISACKAVKQFGAMFFFSCKIIAMFIDILQSAATGLAGWARLMMVLVKGYRGLVPAYRQLAAAL